MFTCQYCILILCLVTLGKSVLVDECTCDSLCLTYGDPHFNDFQGGHNLVKCSNGASIVAYSSASLGMEVGFTCAGTYADSKKSWVSEVVINGEVKFTIADCQSAFDNSSEVKTSLSTTTFPVIGTGGKSSLQVDVHCIARSSYPMYYQGKKYPGNIEVAIRKTNTKVPANYQAANMFSTYEKDAFDASGFCMPRGSTVQRVITRDSDSTVCSLFGYPDDCRTTPSCDKSTCTTCLNNEGDNCTACLAANEECDNNVDCCGNAVCETTATSNGKKVCSSGSVDESMQCCSTLGCRPSSLNSNVGTCQTCVEQGGSCSSSTECCNSQKCKSGTCGGPENFSSCSCVAKCKAVADPHTRTFISYGKKVIGTEDIILFQRDAGEDTFEDKVVVKQICNDDESKCWISEISLDGEVKASLDDCNLLTPPSNPKRQLRQRGVSKFSVDRDGGSDTLSVEVQCVTKQQIVHSGSRPNARLDVYLQKTNTFGAPATPMSNVNLFMSRALANGYSGVCLEPYQDNIVQALEKPDDGPIRGWTKNIDPANAPQCTCGTDTNPVLLEASESVGSSLRNSILDKIVEISEENVEDQ